MATRIGPRPYTIPIATGLILLWDASDKRSYIPSSSIIYDLAGNYNGTVGAGCSYSTNGGGSITINGPVAIISNTSINMTYEKYTAVVATRYTSSNRGRMLNANNNSWLLGHWGNQAEKYYAEGWVSNSSGGPNDTAWRVFTGTGDTTTDNWKFYVNSELRASNNAGSQGPNGIVIGSFPPGGRLGGSGDLENSSGEFSFLAVYNRVLTEEEILTNYNSIKGRYNLS